MIKADIGNIEGCGWAASVDIGPLAIIAGDIGDGIGLAIAWYSNGLRQAIEITIKKGFQYKKGDA